MNKILSAIWLTIVCLTMLALILYLGIGYALLTIVLVSVILFELGMLTMISVGILTNVIDGE
jgi:hypothetical protein